jgi:hypothetical protein
MRRILHGLALLLAAPLAACSLINAPAEIDSGGGGSGGGTTTTTSGQPCTTVADCPAPAACTVVECKDGVCDEDEAPNNTPCDDGLFCTQDDICVSGACTGGEEVVCAPQNDCRIAVCDEAAQGCVETMKRDGAVCDDKDACTSTSTCLMGVCVPGPSCQSDECVTSMCDPAIGCIPMAIPMGTPCGNTFCSTGQCDGFGKCVIFGINVGLPCDDLQFCTTDEVCSPAGVCQGFTSPCSDPSSCVKASCDEDADICDFTAIPAGGTCEDGDACTGGETCSAAAQCGGAQPGVVYFFESFAALNAAGWELGPEWEIGPAKASMGGNVCCDPAMDFTGDANVAGVALGGNAAVMPMEMPQHPFHWLTSPTIDTSGVPGALYLTYYRWLLSDYPPFMHNNVEVSNDGGASWFVVWEQPANNVAIQDTAWTFQAHDITEYKSPTMRFRFGFDIGQSGVYQAGSWNLDHIKLQNTPCPQ